MTRALSLLFLLATVWIGATGIGFAVEPNERLADPVLEGRARAISEHLRCLVCRNETIDDSHADLAHDLRVLVRERLTAGDSDSQVIAYITARYGDFVLLKPPVKSATLVLWYGPIAILLVGAFGIVVWFKRRRTAGAEEPAPLTEAERSRLKKMLTEGDS